MENILVSFTESQHNIEIEEELINININKLQNLYAFQTASNCISASYASTASYALNSNNTNVIISPKLLYVSVSGSNTDNQYKTVSSALSDFNVGDTIQLAPETFNEDISITKDNVRILGTSKDFSQVKSLTITGKDAVIENIYISGTFYSLCQNGFNFHKATKLNNCRFSDNILIGTNSISNNYGLEFNNCLFDGIDKKIVSNNNSSWMRTWINNSIIYPVDTAQSESWEPASMSYDIESYNGTLSFNNCSLIQLSEINYMNTSFDSQSALEFNWSYLYFYNITNNRTSGNFAVFVARNANVAHLKPLTLDNRFEFDLFDSIYRSPSNPINFNSTAASRWHNISQVGYGCTATLTGSYLENLYIRNSIFGMSAPEGLGEDISNTWETFIDD